VNIDPYKIFHSDDGCWTMSDHVREMHSQGVSPEQIVWRLKLKPETVEKWLDLDDKGL
jgi:hypothetical protein